MTDLRDDLRSTDVEVVYDALIDAGKQGHRDLKELVEAFLTHPDGGLREAALKTLAFYWRLPEYRPVAMRMIRDDDDLDVRAAAAMALGGYAGDLPDVLRLLLDVALDADEDESVRDMAYSAALIRAGVSKAEYPMNRTFPGFERRADWRLLLRLVETTGVEVPEKLRALADERGGR